MTRLRSEMEARVAATYVPGAPAVVIDGFRFAVRIDDHGPVVTTIIERGDSSGTEVVFVKRTEKGNLRATFKRLAKRRMLALVTFWIGK